MTETLHLGPFELLEPLGRGGMGEVWGAVHRVEQFAVAIKVLAAERAASRASRALFAQEVRAVAAMDHPAIVEVYDTGFVDAEAQRRSGGRLKRGSPYLVMERIDGGSLGALAGRLAWDDLRDVLRRLLGGLAHAHARGLVHRDIKFSNVLLGADGARITDFGLAHTSTTETLASGRSLVSGTPAYMAPEQFEGRWRSYGPQTDLYALGCIGWALATGELPFGRGSVMSMMEAHLYRQPPGFEPRHAVPSGLQRWLRCLLSKRVEARFACAADAAWELDRLGEAGGWEPGGTGRAASPDAETLAPDAETVVPDTTETLQQDSVTRVVSGHPAPHEAVVGTGSASVKRPTPPTWQGALATGRTERPAGVGLGLYALRTVPLVGREGERDALWSELVEAAGSGRPRGVLLEGPAGTGKSRLAEWLAESAAELGAATPLRAAHGPEGGRKHGVGSMLRLHLRTQGLGRADLEAHLEHRLRGLGEVDRREVRALAELLATARSEDDEAVASAEDRGPVIRFGAAAERHAVALAYLARLADQRPLVLWLDDLHYSLDSIEFLERLLGFEGPLPVMVVATVRSEALADLRAEARALERLVEGGIRRVRVQRLAERDGRRLVTELLGLRGALASRVAERTGGNPLFAVQLVGDWVERGLLVPSGHGFELRPGASVELPDDLGEVWRARLALLLSGVPDAERAALELAAVLGPQVDSAEWRQTCASVGLPVPEGVLESLLDRRLAEPDPRGADEGWCFGHGMLREALLGLSRESGRLSTLYRAAADRVAADPERGATERQGRYLAAAGELAEAIPVLLEAARIRHHDGQWQPLGRILAEVDELMTRADVPPDDPSWGELWQRRSFYESVATGADEAIAWADRAEVAAREHGWLRVLPQALHRRANALEETGRIEESLAIARAAVSLAEAGDDPETLGDLQSLVAWNHRRRGDVESAREWMTASRRTALEAGDVRRASRTGVQLLASGFRRGGAAEAVAELQEIRATLEASGDRKTLAACFNTLGMALAEAGRKLEAIEIFGLGVTECLGLGAPTGARIPAMNRAEVLVHLGRYDEALPVLEAGLAGFTELGHDIFVAGCHAFLLACKAGMGRWEDYDEHLRCLLEFVRTSGTVDQDLMDSPLIAGRLAMEAGHPARARIAFELVADQARRGGYEERGAAAAELLARLAAGPGGS